MSTKTTIAAHNAALVNDPGIGDLDPPTHTQIRRLLLVAMAPNALGGAEQRVEAMARRVTASFAHRGEADLLSDWATPIPSDAIASVLGLPESDWPMIHAFVQAQFSDADASVIAGTGLAPASQDFIAYVRNQVDIRRRDRDGFDDALERMCAFVGTDGTVFSDDAVVRNVQTLLSAGNETTASLMCNLVWRLLTTPGAIEAVRADRDLVPAAIEESLRLDSPVQIFNRRVREPVTLGGIDCRVDEVLGLSIASGNRDGAEWGADADQFVVSRFADSNSVPGHFGFGLGAHFCVGAALARLSARHGLNALLDATENLRLDDGWTYEKVPYHAVLRPRSLPVRFQATDQPRATVT
jgi:cytochrome P450